MDDKTVINQNGQSVTRPDLNVAFENAALVEDRVFAELTRLEPYNGSVVARRIVPCAVATPDNTAQTTVRASQGADGKLTIMPFRAMVGSRVTSASDARAQWRDV